MTLLRNKHSLRIESCLSTVYIYYFLFYVYISLVAASTLLPRIHTWQQKFGLDGSAYWKTINLHYPFSLHSPKPFFDHLLRYENSTTILSARLDLKSYTVLFFFFELCSQLTQTSFWVELHLERFFSRCCSKTVFSYLMFNLAYTCEEPNWLIIIVLVLTPYSKEIILCFHLHFIVCNNM